MSGVAASADTASRRRRDLLAGPRARMVGVAAVVAAALAAGVIAAVLVLQSEHEEAPAATAALVLLTGWSFIGTGLVAWVRRPENAVGRLMIAVGFVSFLTALGEANASVPFTIGVALGNASLAVFAHLLLAFPSGRLRTRLRRTLAAALYANLVGLQILWLLFADVTETGCSDCVSGGIHEPVRLAENALLTWPNSTVADVIEATQNGLGIALGLVAGGILVRRYAAATSAARRALAPVLLTGVLALVLLLAALATYLVAGDAAGDLRWVALVAYTLVPFAFLVGFLRSRLARSAVGSLVIELGETPGPSELRASLARVLSDPSLELAYHVGDGRFVDPAGQAVALPGPRSTRVSTTVERNGKPIASLIHDRSLRENPELLDAVTAATAMALENERLQAELRARLDELQRERDFLSTVANVTPSLLCVVDRDGHIVRANRAFAAATGLGLPGRAAGETFADVFVDRSELAVATDGSPLPERESEWRGADGGRVVVAWSSTPITDAEGRPRALICGVDVTERKRHEEELRHSRARIVEAGDTERRRLERNLHDGAQQRLVSLALILRLAESRFAEDPAAAHTLVRQAVRDLGDALAELRELARGIHPAVVTESGLRGALELLSRRTVLPIEIAAVPDTRLPEAVEVAAYYTIAESVTNAARHARATKATVAVGFDNGRATVEVRDDGIGGADPARGTGLRGLRDRLEALDGTLTITSAPGRGTTIRAEIPCRRT